MVAITKLLATKLYIPRARPSLVSRARLLERLDQGLQGKLTLISALPGSGKTTLVSEWVAANADARQRVAWVSLDESDNDSPRFWSYIVKAIETLFPDIGEDAQHVLSLLHAFPAPPVEAILVTLINAIATVIQEDVILVLDDYHAIAVEAISDELTFFLDHMPEQMHLVVITRVDPPLPLARLRVRNQLTEIRTDDLRYTPAETLAYLNQTMKLHVSAEDAALITERTEGWIAGIQLAVLSLQRQGGNTDLLRTFNGGQRYVYEYLAQEVLTQQPEHIQHFLLHTAILQRFSADLCNVVTGRADSQDILYYLDTANLFLISLDHEQHWYRYHALFCEFLQRSLERTQSAAYISALHVRAALWFEQQQLMNEAVHHMLASGDFEQAAALIERIARAVWMRGESQTLHCWLQDIPESILHAHPQLTLFYVWSLIGINQTDKAQQQLDAVMSELRQRTVETVDVQKKENSDLQQRTMQAEVIIAQATLARFHNDVTRTIELSEQALRYLPQDNDLLRSITMLNLGHAYRLRGDSEAASESFKQAIKLGRAIGNIYTVLLALNTMIQVQIEHGALRSAEAYCAESRQFAAHHNCQQLSIMSQTYVKAGELFYQRNKLAEAAQQVEEGIRLGQNKGGLRFLLDGYMVQARLLQAQGDGSRALAVLENAANVAREHGSTLHIQHIRALRARLQLAQGQLAPAFAWLQDCPVRAGDTPEYTYEFEYLTLARILLAQGKAQEVAGLLERLRQAALVGKRTGVMIEILLLQALANYARQQKVEAFTALERALSFAEPEDYIRIFVDEGRAVAQLLTKLLEWQTTTGARASTTDSLQDYVQKVLTAFALDNVTTPVIPPIAAQNGASKIRQQELPPILESLGAREIEVLHYLAAGLSNQMIAEEMVVALSTVKSHLKSIYRKLHVDSRTQAVARARELHLL